MRILFVLSALCLISACSSSSKSNIYENGIPTAVVELSNARVQDFDVLAPSDFPEKPGDLRQLTVHGGASRIQPGDVFDVTIFDAGEDGILARTKSTALNLGRFTVGKNGSVTLPYVGNKKATDFTVEGLQKQIVASLRGASIDPQAVITMVERPSSVVTVNGEIRNPGQFALVSGRDHILDILAQAGGPSTGAGRITVTRRDQRSSVSLEQIMNDTTQNINLLPGDQIIVSSSNSVFTALGSFKNTGEYSFELGKFTLPQAIARAGGLQGESQENMNLYVFRSPSTVKQTAENNSLSDSSKSLIFHVDLGEISNFVLMHKFYIRDGDILLASDSKIDKSSSIFKKISQLGKS
ncbi:polysaccharide biosynthesis/export family protein [Ochrobactrum sp. GPK 3]|uniref:polysaccharide biosynthesis/export family protein n=1 Tax=Brucella sp. 22210 TaxID=3453892 RepID=UPI0031385637